MDRISPHEKCSGVEEAAAALPLAFTGSNVGWGFIRADQPEPPLFHADDAAAHWVTPGYFEPMRTPLLAGREFEQSDAIPNAPKIVIINKTLAQRYFPNDNPIGKSLKTFGPPDGSAPLCASSASAMKKTKLSPTPLCPCSIFPTRK